MVKSNVKKDGRQYPKTANTFLYLAVFKSPHPGTDLAFLQGWFSTLFLPHLINLLKETTKHKYMFLSVVSSQLNFNFLHIFCTYANYSIYILIVHKSYVAKLTDHFYVHNKVVIVTQNRSQHFGSVFTGHTLSENNVLAHLCYPSLLIVA